MSSNIISPTLQSKNYLEEMKKAGKKFLILVLDKILFFNHMIILEVL